MSPSPLCRRSLLLRSHLRAGAPALFDVAEKVLQGLPWTTRTYLVLVLVTKPNMESKNPTKQVAFGRFWTGFSGFRISKLALSLPRRAGLGLGCDVVGP